jgi:hypothetical protein
MLLALACSPDEFRQSDCLAWTGYPTEAAQRYDRRGDGTLNDDGGSGFAHFAMSGRTSLRCHAMPMSCLCDAYAMPMPMLCQAARFCVWLLCIASTISWGFFFPFSSATALVQHRRLLSEQNTVLARNLPLPRPSTRSTPEVERDHLLLAPCTTSLHRKGLQAVPRAKMTAARSRPCLGFPPLCPDRLRGGKVTRIPGSGQGPFLQRGWKRDHELWLSARVGKKEEGKKKDEGEKKVGKRCAPMWLAGLPCSVSHKTFGLSMPRVHSMPFWQILDAFERTTRGTA